MEITWHGHSCFQISNNGTEILIDPFLSENPKASSTHEELDATQILVTHGHFDHLGDTVEIAKRTGAPIAGTFELTGWCESEGATGSNQGANIGGTVEFDGGWAKLVPAIHTSQIEGGPCTVAHGFVVGIDGKTIYHLGDTALTSDFRLVADRTPIDLALVPIGGFYTMDREDAATAVELIRPKQAIPMHYDTFPPIESDPNAFKSDVESKGSTEVVVLEPGQSHSI